MCYKDESQRNVALKLEEMIKDKPEFIQNYFVFLTSNKSKLSYWSHIHKLLEWLIEQKVITNDLNNIVPSDLNNVTDIHMIKYLDGLKLGTYGTKNSYGTINTKKNVFSGFWSYLQDKEYVNKNIITKQLSKKYAIKEEKEVTVPTEAELEMLISNLSNIKSEIISIRDIAIVKLFKGSGIRIEELVGLDMKDLDFADDKQKFVWVMEKGEYNEKVKVAINKEAFAGMDDYLKIRNIDSKLKDLQPVFLSERKDKNGNNNRLAQSSIQDFFFTYSNGTVHPHMIRHYVGTMIYRSENGSLEMACDQLRHKDINTTKKYYLQKDKQQAYNVLDSI